MPGGNIGKTTFSSQPFIPGTMIKMPEGATVNQVVDNFDANKLGIKLPSHVKQEDFTSVLKGKMKLDTVTQEYIKGMNPGKFGPMSDPFALSRQAGLQMDSMGNFLVKASEGAPGNPFIVKAKALEAEGKYKEAAEVFSDPKAPFANYPDALVWAYQAQLKSKAGEKQKAVEDIEKTLAIAPNNESLYSKAGEIFKEAGITGPKVFVNGVKPDFDVKPFIQEGRTLVPFRALCETLGAQVGWNAETQTITVLKGSKVIEMTIGNNTALVDGKQTTLDVPPSIVDGRTVVPLRFVGESLDTKVSYDDNTEIIKVLPK